MPPVILLSINFNDGTVAGVIITFRVLGKQLKNKNTPFSLFPFLLIIISLVIVGCKRPRPLAEPPPEPGLFSGKSGQFEYYNSGKKRRKRR